jgi:DNA-binding NtrC family response regulator
MGEVGTGKSLLAKQLHHLGPRSKKPFVEVNFGAASPELFVSELFGAKKGAYTGLDRDKPGYFDTAQGGVIFFDELGELPLELQPRLLTALSARKYHRLAEPDKERNLDVHMVCATNRDLPNMVEQGAFRRDLLSRLQINRLTLPSLRSCGPADISLLLRWQVAAVLKLPDGSLPALNDYFTSGAERFLLQYHWPENVRQLMNLFLNESIRRCLMTAGRERISEGHVRTVLLDSPLQENVRQAQKGAETQSSRQKLPPGMSWDELVRWGEEMRRDYVVQLLREEKANKTAVARRLKIARQTLYTLMTKWGLEDWL